MALTKSQILETLAQFIRQKPGLEFGNYGDVSSYRSEMRSITKDRHQAETLLAAVSWRDAITADDLIKASEHAYSGRLTIRETENGGCTIDYCAGQYFPTEYRRAVCAMLASAIWDYWRKHCMPAPTLKHNTETGETVERFGPQQLRAGDHLRHALRKEFGASIARRWFN